jgi:hypothetical protein
LIRWSLKSRLYDPDFSDALIATAGAAAHEAWAVRHVAALLLQPQFLFLRASDIAEHDRLFVCLGIKARAGLQVPLPGIHSRRWIQLPQFVGFHWRMAAEFEPFERLFGCI